MLMLQGNYKPFVLKFLSDSQLILAFRVVNLFWQNPVYLFMRINK